LIRYSQHLFLEPVLHPSRKLSRFFSAFLLIPEFIVLLP